MWQTVHSQKQGLAVIFLFLILLLIGSFQTKCVKRYKLNWIFLAVPHVTFTNTCLKIEFLIRISASLLISAEVEVKKQHFSLIQINCFMINSSPKILSVLGSQEKNVKHGLNPCVHCETNTAEVRNQICNVGSLTLCKWTLGIFFLQESSSHKVTCEGQPAQLQTVTLKQSLYRCWFCVRTVVSCFIFISCTTFTI